MFSLVLGGAASGKSSFAERWITQFPQPRIYLATLQPCDEECRQRIARHRTMRAGKGFTTVERSLNLAGWECPQGSAVLLECLGNLVANELYDVHGAGASATDAILTGVNRLLERSDALAVVSNQVFSDGVPYDDETKRYIDCLGKLHDYLASQADEVVEVVCGIPVWLKGGNDHAPVGGG